MSGQTPDLPVRPQYGEYATPEEQRARIRQPDITASLAAGVTAAAPAVAAEPAPTRPAAVAPRSRMVDRMVTFALLAYGLVTVVTSIPALMDYSAYADTLFGMFGVDVELGDPASARPWAIAAALVLAIGWAVTAALSWWSLRRGRLTWWIPLVGGLVFTFASSTLMAIPLLSDPAAWDALVQSIR